MKNPSRLALASLSFAGAVVAQETAVTNRLPSIVVTATRVSDNVDATAATVSSVDSSDFKAGKFSSVAQALELVPGLSYVSSGTPGQQASVFVRGTEANHTLLLNPEHHLGPRRVVENSHHRRPTIRGKLRKQQGHGLRVLDCELPGDEVRAVLAKRPIDSFLVAAELLHQALCPLRIDGP